MSGGQGEVIERRARLVLFGSIALSLLLHGAFSVALALLPDPSTAMAAVQNERLEFEVVEDDVVPEPEPEPVAEPEPEPVAEPEPEPAPQTPPPRPPPPTDREAPPPPRDTPPEPPAPQAEQVQDFGGLVLGATSGSGWSTAQANGQDTTGPIGNPVARTTGRNVAGSAEGAVGGTGTAPATRTVNYSRRARPPAGLNSLLRRYYPSSARARGVEGRARIMIRVAADGTSQGVRVISESPAGEGFGQACMQAMNGASGFSPALDEDGEPVASGPSPMSCTFRQGR